MKASYFKHILDFKRPSGTSRGVLNQKETWFIKLEETGRLGIGECAILRGLSLDDRSDYEDHLKWACNNIHQGLDALYRKLEGFPSIQFGLETAFKSFENATTFELFSSPFLNGEQGIPINGLIWMGDIPFMQDQIEEKLEAGFDCIKMKIGALNFDEELSVLKSIRQKFTSDQITLRVDANGAFTPAEALDKLKKLAALDIHSIEQPIQAGQQKEMARLCAESPLPIALDEELIPHIGLKQKKELLQTIRPQYIILKPSLIGGFRGSDTWIQLAEELNIGWWITSALESNIGLNAIAQYTAVKNNTMPQGLGTGGLFTNNVSSPLKIKNGQLWYDTSDSWSFQF